jgi:bifunctional non-homologous end joining protein LigD
MAHTYKPQLARLVKTAPEGDEWLHEVKYDGYRIGADVRGRTITLISRNGNDWTGDLPEIARELRKLGIRDALFDGEVAIVLPDGRTSFQALQNAFSGQRRTGLVYFVFDLLRADGRNLQRLPLEERKAALLDLLGKPKARSVIRYSEHVTGDGARMFEQACRLRLEGIVSKRRDAPYKPGRADTWVKTKCVLRQEFVIGGFTDPEGSRQGIGALLVGYFDDEDRLAFAGKVGTGFTTAGARQLRATLDRIEQDTSPFSPPPAGWLRTHAHWVKPRLVGEVVFSEWTDDGKIRHPSFQGLRRDKDAKAVRREEPQPESDATPRGPAHGAALVRKVPKSAEGVTVAGVRISHPDRELYPGTGITKLTLARFYERIAEWIVPHLAGRPLTLVRCPTGIGADCFYMKHSKVWAPPALRRVRIQEKTKLGEYLVVDNVAALISLVQMDVLEIHTWNTRVERVEYPDRLVFDIDPGSKVPWPAVLDAARLVRRLLKTAGLESFPKTTGGNGLHVVVPLEPTADWQVCLAFSRAIAAAIERHDPNVFTTAFAKAGRERKILIDYLRNNRTNTSVAAYSTRAREGAPVSVPLRWQELTARLNPRSFTVLTLERRLGRMTRDPWAEYWKTRQRLSSRVADAVAAL